LAEGQQQLDTDALHEAAAAFIWSCGQCAVVVMDDPAGAGQVALRRDAEVNGEVEVAVEVTRMLHVVCTTYGRRK
jgi:hypothetical protein